MGSLEEDRPVVGQYMHPLISPDTQNGDPWQRNYYAPPSLKPLVPRSYSLIDARPLLSVPEYCPVDLLKSHGFAVVKHRSTFLDQLDGELAEHAVAEVYHPEIQRLVLETTGAKRAFVVGSVFRQGKRAPEEFKIPTGLRPVSQAVGEDRSKHGGTNDNKPVGDAQPHKLAGQSKLSLAAPVRIPHVDFTPLGARQTNRSQEQDIYNAALQSGVIAAEDKICENHSFGAATKAADSIIAEQYNPDGQLGPRYAAYSIWRPLKKVGRDPITLAPRREVPSVGGEMVHWPYENRIPGPAELDGDFLKEYAMLGVRGEKPFAESSPEALKWYYVSAQEPDEVLLIKLFDSASLGANAQHAGAPWHASPEIGDAALTDEPRESIDIRILAFW